MQSFKPYFIVVILVASYIARIFVTQWRSTRFNIQSFPARYVGLRLNNETYSFYLAPCNGLQGAVAQYATNQTRNTRADPFSFNYCSILFSCHRSPPGHVDASSYANHGQYLARGRA